MGIPELILTAIALSMDAFAVSVCKGLAMKKVTMKQIIVIGTWFGGFQALMPLIGYFIGHIFKSLMESSGGIFEKYISIITSSIAFILLSIIGIIMIKEAFSKEEKEEDCSICFKTMIVLAIATSIDALAVGVTVSLLDANIWLAITLIGVITFILSFIGSIIGAKIGSKFEKKAELVGGVVLVLLALKFLIEAII